MIANRHFLLLSFVYDATSIMNTYFRSNKFLNYLIELILYFCINVGIYQVCIYKKTKLKAKYPLSLITKVLYFTLIITILTVLSPDG